MTEIIKKSTFYIKMLLIIVIVSQIDMSFAVEIGGPGGVGSKIGNSGDNFITTVEDVVAFFVKFLYLVAVIFGLYAGFTILTAAGDEEKVKKGKTTMINVFIGLIVIFFSSIIINWVISRFSTGTVIQ